MPNIYIIGGANGSGKTTVALKLLPNFGDCFAYVNADIIATGLSVLNPGSVAIQAGRLMLQRLQTLSQTGANFAFESTLAARTFAPFLRNCQIQGYTVNLIYFWLQSPELAIERVRRRVESGGHSIPEDIIRRRYDRGIRNLEQLYLPLCDSWIVYDNTGESPRLIAEKSLDQEPIIDFPDLWHQIFGREIK